MTTKEFTTWRLAALRSWFKARFGRHWHRIVSKQLGFKYQYSAFRYPSRPIRSFYTLEKLEEVAIRYGWNSEAPFERKRAASIDLVQ
jgi:hypothetical protein